MGASVDLQNGELVKENEQGDAMEDD